MQNAAYGIYRNGQVFLDEPAPQADESKVIVVFLENEPQKAELKDIFKIHGAWEDDRDVNAIIDDVRGSRIARADIRL
ncbi:MAG: hypothetical protein FWH16_04325 [Oscillospiraceae bacterium]|nr:hypothetical protein [Oscillospiraceae bacterium]